MIVRILPVRIMITLLVSARRWSRGPAPSSVSAHRMRALVLARVTYRRDLRFKYRENNGGIEGTAVRRGIRLILSIAIVVVLTLPYSVAQLQTAASAIGRITASSTALSANFLSQPTPKPGYSNGNDAYLDNFTISEGAATGGPILCAPFSIISFSASPNYGNPPLRVTLTVDTKCGLAPYAVTWTFGDGNVSTQSVANISYNSGADSYADFIYNHTYEYIGAFIPKVSITDNGGSKISASTPVYASFVPSLFYCFYNDSKLIQDGKNGSGTSIGLVEECNKNARTSEYQSDLNQFDAEFNLTPTTLSYFFSGGSSCTSAGTELNGNEVSLDIEWAHVAAPGAKIYVCLDTLDTVSGLEACDASFYQNRTSYQNLTVSNSWGFCAIDNDSFKIQGCTNAPDPYVSTWKSAEQAGINMLASVGDYAANAACAEADYDASNNYSIAVGGTTVTGVGSSGSYGSEKQWYNVTTQGQNGCNVNPSGKEPLEHPGDTAGNNRYYNATSSQYALLGDTTRYFPDVSMVGDPATGVPIVFGGNWTIVGGDSVGSPVWAGILSVLIQARAPGLSGFAASFLYSHPACFHEIMNQVGNRDGLGSPDVGCLSKA
jgi:subtilase family serine protease